MLWIDPKPRARAQDRNHIVLLQVTVTAFCTKFGSAWSSIIFQPLHDLNCHSWFWRSFLAKNISLFYKDISGPHIILHDASVLALWPVPEGAASVLSRSFEYQQRRSSSWGLKEGIDHLWWIGTCAVQEKWLVNGWKMWELVLSSKSLLLSPLWHKGPRAPVVWEMQNGRGERERERETMAVGPSGCWWHLLLGQSGCSCLLLLSSLAWLTIHEQCVCSSAPAMNGP